MAWSERQSLPKRAQRRGRAIQNDDDDKDNNDDIHDDEMEDQDHCLDNRFDGLSVSEAASMEEEAEIGSVKGPFLKEHEERLRSCAEEGTSYECEHVFERTSFGAMLEMMAIRLKKLIVWRCML